MILIAMVILLTACGDRANPLASPGATAPVWEESPPAVAEDKNTQPPAGTPPTPAQAEPSVSVTATPVPTKEPETTPPPTPPVPTEKKPEATDTPIDDEAFPQTAALLQSATAYDAEKSKTHTLSAGTTLRVAKEAEGEWLKAKDGSETVWFHLNEPDGIMVETPTGYFFLWVVIDGLDYT